MDSFNVHGEGEKLEIYISFFYLQGLMIHGNDSPDLWVNDS